MKKKDYKIENEILSTFELNFFIKISKDQIWFVKNICIEFNLDVEKLSYEEIKELNKYYEENYEKIN